ncbi:MAG TPA: hypothetical protein VKP12_06770 [Kiloniellaceae bacterium]|nr:hypothetical protein [Kiloniellaceae bacterium]
MSGLVDLQSEAAPSIEEGQPVSTQVRAFAALADTRDRVAAHQSLYFGGWYVEELAHERRLNAKALVISLNLRLSHLYGSSSLAVDAEGLVSAHTCCSWLKAQVM